MKKPDYNDCNICKHEFEAKEPKPCSKVTVWLDVRHDKIQYPPDVDWIRKQYSFSGTPDVDSEVEKTLGKGALCIKIECTEEFKFDNHYEKTALIWRKELNVTSAKWSYKDYTACYKTTGKDYMIERAITEYLTKSQVKTKVTVWSKPNIVSSMRLRPAVKTYSFTGTPDIDRVIRETLGKGALAVKVGCTEGFDCPREIKARGLFLWIPSLCLDVIDEYDDYVAWSYNWEGSAAKKQYAIESAITEYLAKDYIQVGDIVMLPNNKPVIVDDSPTDCAFMLALIDACGNIITTTNHIGLRKATPGEVLKWFTVEVDKEPTVVYEENGRYKIMQQNNSYKYLEMDTKKRISTALWSAFVEKYNIIPIPYAWWSKLWDEPQYPRRK